MFTSRCMQNCGCTYVESIALSILHVSVFVVQVFMHVKCTPGKSAINYTVRYLSTSPSLYSVLPPSSHHLNTTSFKSLAKVYNSASSSTVMRAAQVAGCLLCPFSHSIISSQDTMGSNGCFFLNEVKCISSIIKVEEVPKLLPFWSHGFDDLHFLSRRKLQESQLFNCRFNICECNQQNIITACACENTHTHTHTHTVILTHKLAHTHTHTVIHTCKHSCTASLFY